MVVAMQMAHLEECWWYKGGQVSLGQSKARLSEKLISKEAEEVARHSSQEETKTDNIIIIVVTFTLISNLDYIQKRRGESDLFSFEYNLLFKLI